MAVKRPGKNEGKSVPSHLVDINRHAALDSRTSRPVGNSGCKARKINRCHSSSSGRGFCLPLFFLSFFLFFSTPSFTPFRRSFHARLRNTRGQASFLSLAPAATAFSRFRRLSTGATVAVDIKKKKKNRKKRKRNPPPRASSLEFSLSRRTNQCKRNERNCWPTLRNERPEGDFNASSRRRDERRAETASSRLRACRDAPPVCCTLGASVNDQTEYFPTSSFPRV